MLSMDARPAKEAPPTRATFVAMLTRDGFAQAIPAYASLHAKDASVVYGASELNDWGYRLLASGRAKDGIEMFKLATHLFPTDGNLFDSLAEGYEADGQTAMAIKHYQRALDLDPKNKHAVDRLKALAK
jgi:tetratricopeptide (TPR) repeat protein